MSRSRIATLSVVAILLGQLAIRAYLGRDGYFSLDDFVFYDRATHAGFWDPDFLLTAYNGHVMPGAFAWVWLSTALAPLNFGVVFWTMMALQLVAGVLMYVLLRLMFGHRRAIAVPLAMFSFTTITLPASWWWAAAVNQQPQIIAMLLAIIFHVLYVRSGRWYWALASPLAVAFGLLFFEKTALAVPFIGLMTWFFWSEGTVVRSLGTALRRYWLTWVGHLAVLVPFVAYYVTQVPDQVRTKPTTENFIDLFDATTRQAIVPGLFGGPWGWSDTGFIDSNASPHPVMQVVAFGLLAVAIGLSVRWSPSAMRAWSLAGIFVIALTVVLTLTRGAIIGAEVIGSEYRYLTDFSVFGSICVALAFLQMAVRPWWREVDPPAAPAAFPPHVYGVRTSVVATISVLLLVVSSTVSAAMFADRWTSNPARTYFTNATEALEDLGPDDRLYDGVVPTNVVWRVLYPANLPLRILEPLGLESRALVQGEATHQLREFGADGVLRPSQVSGVGTSLFETPDCLADVSGEPKLLPLTSTVFEWPWILQIGYTSRETGTLVIDAGPDHIVTPIGVGPSGPGGLRTVYAAVTGGYDAVTLTAEDATFCIKTLAIGAPQPNEW